MTHNEINSSRTCSKDKCGTVIDKEARHCLSGSGCNDREIRHIKTSSLSVSKRREQDRGQNPHPRSKNSLHCKAVSKSDPRASGVCEEVKKQLERNRHPIFGGFSPKCTGAAFREESSIEIFSLNTAMID
jgi:hypothetical protein